MRSRAKEEIRGPSLFSERKAPKKMNVQVVIAHPLSDSFAAGVARTAIESLLGAGHSVIETNLYAEGFDPCLNTVERAHYCDPGYDTSMVGDFVDRMRRCEGLVLVYPQWWFDMPAILKGWFDRVWAPGVAFRHDPSQRRIKPLLTHLRRVVVLTSFGSPWWVVALYLRNPGRRTLGSGVLKACAPQARLDYVVLYDMDRADLAKRKNHLARIAATMRGF